MALLNVVFRQFRWPFIGVILLTLLSAVLGIAMIAYINSEMISAINTSLSVLPGFLLQLVLLMELTLSSQLALALALTLLGHQFVWRLRGEFIKRILDTRIERLEQIGNAMLLTGLYQPHSGTLLLDGKPIGTGGLEHCASIFPPCLPTSTCLIG